MGETITRPSTRTLNAVLRAAFTSLFCLLLATGVVRGDPTFLAIKGISEADKGNHMRAIELFSEAIGEGILADNLLAPIFIHRAASLNAIGNHQQAIADSTRAISIDPNQPTAFIQRAVGLKETGELERAILDFGRAIEIDPTDADAWMFRGVALSDQGHFVQSNEDYFKALSITPDNSKIYYFIGLNFYLMFEFEKSMEYFENAISINPDIPEYYFYRGIINWGSSTRQVELRGF